MTEIAVDKSIEEEPIEVQTTQTWIDIYVKDYGELPTETFEKTHRKKLDIPRIEEMAMLELVAIFKVRSKFLERVATPGQIKWLEKMMRNKGV